MATLDRTVVYSDDTVFQDGELGGEEEEEELADLSAAVKLSEQTVVVEWDRVSRALQKSLDDCIHAALLLGSDGSMLGYSGDLSKESRRTVPPMLVSIWSTTNFAGKRFVNASELGLILLSNQEGLIALGPLLDHTNKLFLALIAREGTQMGYLKIKYEVVTGEISQMLSAVFQPDHSGQDSEPEDEFEENSEEMASDEEVHDQAASEDEDEQPPDPSDE